MFKLQGRGGSTALAKSTHIITLKPRWHLTLQIERKGSDSREVTTRERHRSWNGNRERPDAFTHWENVRHPQSFLLNHSSHVPLVSSSISSLMQASRWCCTSII
jgi:hypothetical protein